MPEGDIGRVMAAQAEAREAMRQLLPDDSTIECTATDPGKVLKVTVGAGGRIAQIGLEPHWRRAIDPSVLGTMIVQAAEAAAEARLRAWYAKAEEQPQLPSPQADSVAEAVAESITEIDAVRSLRHAGRAAQAQALEVLQGALGESLASLDQRRQQAVSHAAQQRSVQNRHVAVTFAGKDRIVDIRFDQQWLAREHEMTISRETQQLVHQGYVEADERASWAESATGPVQVLTHPSELVRQVVSQDGVQP